MRPFLTVRLVVCDDDADVRSIVTRLAERHGHEVIAETDNAPDAVQLIERFRPEAVVLDLGLRIGRGQDVLAGLTAVGEQGCQVIVFSAFGNGDRWALPGVTVVVKPDFQALELAFDRLATSGSSHVIERRRQPDGSRAISSRLSAYVVDQAQEFYPALELAQPGDALLAITVDVSATMTSPALDELMAAAVGTIRIQDRVLRLSRCVVLLLVGGTPKAPALVAGRVRTASDRADLLVAEAILTSDEPPFDAFQRVTGDLLMHLGPAPE